MTFKINKKYMITLAKGIAFIRNHLVISGIRLYPKVRGI